MLWNAASTFVESNADVSMKDRLFFSEKTTKMCSILFEEWKELPK